MKTYQAELFVHKKHNLAESPFYDDRTDTFSWVDITEGNFYKMKDQILTCIAFDEMIGAAIPVEPAGTYLVVGTSGIYRVDPADERELVLDLTPFYGTKYRSNDAKCDPKGRLFFGSLTLSGEPSGNLYQYTDGKVKILEPNTKIANGMAWSRDHRTFYFADSTYHQVFRYDYDEATGEICNRQVLFEVTDGVPDGLTIDAADNLWVAIWGGRRVEHRDGRTGELLAVVEVPAEQVSSCTLFGKEQDQLFITTAGDGMSGECDGCLFTCAIDPAQA